MSKVLLESTSNRPLMFFTVNQFLFILNKQIILVISNVHLNRVVTSSDCQQVILVCLDLAFVFVLTKRHLDRDRDEADAYGDPRELVPF